MKISTFLFVSSLLFTLTLCQPDCGDDGLDSNGNALFFPFPGDCMKYFLCDHTIAIQFECPWSLFWSQELLTCTWPELSGCVQPDLDEPQVVQVEDEPEEVQDQPEEDQPEEVQDDSEVPQDEPTQDQPEMLAKKQKIYKRQPKAHSKLANRLKKH